MLQVKGDANNEAKLEFGDEFGGALTLIHNASEDQLTCSGKMQASDVIIEGTSTRQLMSHVLYNIPPAQSCLDQYLVLGPGHLALPRVHSVHAVSFWIFIEPVQGTHRWNYILDARPGLTNGYLAFLSGNYLTGNGILSHLRIGSSWQKLIVHGAGAHTQTFGGVGEQLEVPANSSLEWVGKWRHMYLEASVPFEGEITVGGRYAWGSSCIMNCSSVCGGDCRETLDASLLAFSLWGRALNETEVERLAAGEGLISDHSNGALLASYSASLAVSNRSRTVNNTAVDDATRQFAAGQVLTVLSSSLPENVDRPDNNTISPLESHAYSSELPLCVAVLWAAPLMDQVIELKAEVAQLTTTVALLQADIASHAATNSALEAQVATLASPPGFFQSAGFAGYFRGGRTCKHIFEDAGSTVTATPDGCVYGIPTRVSRQ